MSSRISALLVLTGVALVAHECRGAAEYYGRYIGPLSRLFHSVSGDVYAVDARTLHIRDFTYDGEGPAAYFYAGNTKTVGPGGFIVRDETGSNGVLKRYNKKHITVTLPEGKTLNNIRWISVWCEEFQVNFGDIQIPRGLDFPKPQKIGALSGVHGVSSDNIVVVDAQTLLIPSFSYDGEAPDAKFWVGRGPKPSPQGIRVPDENGKQEPLRRYDRKTIVLTLPGELTIFDIGHFGVWCEAFTVDFGHLQIPPALNVPPSLKMLGVSPQKRSSLAINYEQPSSNRERPQESTRIGFENVLPLFNIQQIQPTTYRPPTHHHRFGPPPNLLNNKAPGETGGVQIQTSVSLTPEPIVFTQVGNEGLQRVFPQPQPQPHPQPQPQHQPDYQIQPQPLDYYHQYQILYQRAKQRQEEERQAQQQQHQQQQQSQSYHIQLPPLAFQPQPIQQRYISAPGNLILPPVPVPSYVQSPPSIQDLPNPYHDLVHRRSQQYLGSYNRF